MSPAPCDPRDLREQAGTEDERATFRRNADKLQSDADSSNLLLDLQVFKC